jgi:hypothetical protein
MNEILIINIVSKQKLITEISCKLLIFFVMWTFIDVKFLKNVHLFGPIVLIVSMKCEIFDLEPS